MPFPFCGKKNKEDRHDPPYAPKIERVSIEDSTARLNEEKDKLKVDFSNLQRQLKEAKAELDKKEKVADQLSETKRDLEDEVRKYKKQLSDAEYAKKVVETEKVALEKKVKSVSDATDGLALSAQKEITKEATSKLESELSNLQNAKKRIEEERDSVQKQLKDVEDSHKTALSQLESHIDKLEKENEEAGEKIKSYKHEKDVAETNLAHTKKELEHAKKESHIPRSPTGHPSDVWMTKLKNTEQELKNEREGRLEKEKDISRLTNEKDQLKKDKDEILQKVQILHSVVEDAKKNKENAERSHRTEVDRLRSEFKKSITEKEAENNTLLTRLSVATAAQILDGNPNVSDLSDPNRPQKLGEQMSTLYDDQWTDASEELEKLEKFSEDEMGVVTTLFDLIKNVYNHCKEASENQLSRIEEDIFLPPMENPPPSSPDTNGTDQIPVKSPSTKHSASKIPRYASLSGRTGVKIPRFSSHKSRPALPNLNPGKKTVDAEPGKEKEKKQRSNTGSKVKGEKVPEIPVEVRKGIKDYRKHVAKQVIQVIEKEVLTKLRNSPDFGDAVVDACLSYIKKCVEICWNMCVQDPPVVLKWDLPPDYKFDTDRYRAYTKSGSYVDYVVWPIIYLNEGGSILMKGVAQGKAS